MKERSVCNFMTSGERRMTKVDKGKDRVERSDGNERKERR